MSEAYSNWRDLLAASQRALRDVVAGVGTDDWENPTPCDKWTVTQVFQHAAGDQHGFNATLTGGPPPDFNPFEPSGKLDGDALAYLDRVLADAETAWGGVADDAEEVPSPIPGPPRPAGVVSGSAALDAAVHAWDIAVATGQPSPLNDDLARRLLEVNKDMVDQIRQFGPFYAEVAETGPDADAVSALLSHVGRRADWSA